MAKPDATEANSAIEVPRGKQGPPRNARCTTGFLRQPRAEHPSTLDSSCVFVARGRYYTWTTGIAVPVQVRVA